MQPLCFVLMPFGAKTVPSGLTVNFDAVYASFIQPAIVAAGMEPLRADHELIGGIIHKPMFERLMLCEFAIADLTGANANVFYELGLRHGIRPATTVLVTAEPERLPFDINLTHLQAGQERQARATRHRHRRPETPVAGIAPQTRRTGHRQPGFPAGQRLSTTGPGTSAH